MQSTSTVKIITRTSSSTTIVSPWSDSPNPSPTSPSSTTSSEMHYRIEQRRSIYVKTDIPPSQWDTVQLNDILDFGEKAGSPTNQDMHMCFATTASGQDRTFASYPENRLESGAGNVEPPKRSSIFHRPKADVTAPSRISTAIPTRPQRGSRSPRTPTRPRILFYHKTDPHYGFTNFSPHPVFYDNKRYPTSEHLFQSFKFQPHRPNLAEHIRTCSEHPSVAFSEARRFQPEVRSDWKDVNIQMMDLALWYKFTQHDSLKRELLATNDAELIEVRECNSALATHVQ
ncbi:DUF1768 domain-containing protein [Favolaschia claudopus]|uniref:DUF1768 domain-containing protein n=1 Tax=Favolaschia claudopus TaxID=2862362 RepID=A0AAW0AC28_9AGAR